jgi:hypothetical protein
MVGAVRFACIAGNFCMDRASARRPFGSLGLSAMAALLVVCLVAPAAAELASHRAVYDVRLGKARSGGGVVDARGLTTIELKRDCEGWITVQRMSTELDLAGGRSTRQLLEYSSWEAFDGARFQFVARSRFDDKSETYSGDAAVGAPGTARFREPASKNVALPEGTMFPIAHTRALIDRATAGERLVNRRVFDGTEDKDPPNVSAFIGARKAAGQHLYGKVGELAKRPGWRVRMAYHEAHSAAAEPTFEVSLLQLDNGVAPYVVLDYQDFSLVLELRRIEALPSRSC